MVYTAHRKTLKNATTRVANNLIVKDMNMLWAWRCKIGVGNVGGTVVCNIYRGSGRAAFFGRRYVIPRSYLRFQESGQAEQAKERQVDRSGKYTLFEGMLHCVEDDACSLLNEGGHVRQSPPINLHDSSPRLLRYNQP